MSSGFSMDVDPPVATNSGTNLKRSSSAPMINIALLDNNSNGDELIPPQLFGSQPRTRRFSASFSPNSSPNPQSPVMPFRISQIKHEEGMDVVNREVAHEREVRSAMQISRSYDDLTLVDTFLPSDSKRNGSELLPLFISPVPTGSSLSPTRGRRQCYSPTLQQPVRSPNPSPTRKIYASRRSNSPITLRPSVFPAKRKCDLEDKDAFFSPQKRFHSIASLPERTSHLHPLSHSLSSNSLDESESPEQTVPHNSAAGTPESVSSNDSMCSLFKSSGVTVVVDQDMTCMQDNSAPPTPDPMNQNSTNPST